MNILAISYSFPNKAGSYRGIFVKNTLSAIARLGHRVTVVAPRRLLLDEKTEFHTKESGLDVFRPTFISFGSRKIFSIDTHKLTQRSFNSSVMGVLDSIGFVPDVIYSHFLFPSGCAAAMVGRKLNRKVFCVLGESDIGIYEKRTKKDELVALYGNIGGFVTNSLSTKDDVVSRYGLSSDRLTCVPNAVDRSVFFRQDKETCRKELGLPMDKKIVVFVGGFIHRKGPLRVLEACRKASKDIKAIFIGDGEDRPFGPDVLFSEKVEHAKLPYFLNAADVFVLPTLSEGMPNVILEAMACELPIVTSPIQPNLELLGQDYDLFCDPLNIDSIASSINKAMYVGRRSYPKLHDINGRASMIADILMGRPK